MSLYLQISLFFVMAVLADIKVVISGKARIDNVYTALKYNMVVFGVVGASFIVFLLDGKPISSATIVTAAIYGVCTAFFQVLYILAVEKGPISILILIIQFSVFPTSILGTFLFREELKWSQLIGLALMLPSFLLTVKLGGEKKDNMGYFYAIIALCLSTLCNIAQRYHQKTEFANERNKFLSVAYFVALVSATLLLFVLKRRKIETVKMVRKKYVAPGIGVGVVLAAYQFMNIYLSGKTSSMLMYPMLAGLTLVLNFLLCAIIFREKMSAKQTVGAILGTAAMVVMAF